MSNLKENLSESLLVVDTLDSIRRVGTSRHAMARRVLVCRPFERSVVATAPVLS